MIETFKQPIKGGFLITAFYREAGRPITYNRVSSDETRADNLIKQIKKEVLREKVSKFLNHRKNIMENFGGYATENRFQAIQNLKNNLAFREKHSLESNCKLIVDHAELLKSLLPGKESVYHESATEMITEILQFCTIELKIKL